MDAVLCGEVPAAFHDEAMVLYYLNNELPGFAAGKYVPRVGNCDTFRNPHEDKPWGEGRHYMWGDADADNRGGKACALTTTGIPAFASLSIAWTRSARMLTSCVCAAAGEIFHTAGYGLAFGLDNPAFVAWSRAIADLKESHIISEVMSSTHERNYGIGSDGLHEFEKRCGDSASSDQFTLNDFIGLYIILAGCCAAAFLVHFVQTKVTKSAKIDPFDSDFGQSIKLRASSDAEMGQAPGHSKSIEDIEDRVDALRTRQDKSMQHLQAILEVLQSVSRERFAQADADGSGQIDFEEFATMPCNVGIPLDELHRAFEALDTNKNGLLEIDEFVRYCYMPEHELVGLLSVVTFCTVTDGRSDFTTFVRYRQRRGRAISAADDAPSLGHLSSDGNQTKAQETSGQEPLQNETESNAVAAEAPPSAGALQKTADVRWGGLRNVVTGVGLFRRVTSKS